MTNRRIGFFVLLNVRLTLKIIVNDQFFDKEDMLG